MDYEATTVFNLYDHFSRSAKAGEMVYISAGGRATCLLLVEYTSVSMYTGKRETSGTLFRIIGLIPSCNILEALTFLSVGDSRSFLWSILIAEWLPRREVGMMLLADICQLWRHTRAA